jgi:hypothetical protein
LDGGDAMKKNPQNLALKVARVLEKIRTLKELETELLKKGLKHGKKCNPEDIATAERIGFINERLERHIKNDKCGYCACLTAKVIREQLISALNQSLDVAEKI